MAEGKTDQTGKNNPDKKNVRLKFNLSITESQIPTQNKTIHSKNSQRQIANERKDNGQTITNHNY